MLVSEEFEILNIYLQYLSDDDLAFSLIKIPFQKSYERIYYRPKQTRVQSKHCIEQCYSAGNESN